MSVAITVNRHIVHHIDIDNLTVKIIVDSLNGEDYLGIVPVHMSEYEFIDQLPEEFGYIDDCMYADGVKDDWFDKISWFPEDPEELIQ